ncbi:MAG: ZPR1 zinc finger domain-containing protein [Desulfurococcales archaeon]|nr:ZPR1 zinc finger domain-containing protein [Desulfurococcales archaeon]
MTKQENLRKIGELNGKCPICGEETFRITYHIYTTPYVGDIIIETGKCSTCGFRWADVGLLESGKPSRLVLEVNGATELNAIVVKSAPAIIKIPELGVEITPGPAAQGYITTVEGVLLRILEHIPSECLKEGSECYAKVQDIREAMKGNVKFTFILEDPSGKSSIFGEGVNVKVEELQTEDIEP